MGIRSWLDRNSKLYYNLCLFVLFFVAASASFTGFYDKSHFREAGVRGDWYETSFEAMVDGTAHKPYIYRRLLPDTLNLIDAATPRKFKDYLFVHQKSGLDACLIAIASSPTAQNKAYFYRYQLLYLITFGFVLLSTYAMYMVCRVMSVPPAASAFAAVLFIMLMPYFQLPSGFAYDFVELALMCLAVWMAVKFEWYWLIPIVALAEWNKESFLFFIPCLYPLMRRRNSKAATFAGSAVLLLLCGALYLSVRIHFAHNEGTSVIPQYMDQLGEFRNFKSFFWPMDETYGVRVPRVYGVLPIALIVWTVWRGWKKLSPAVKLHAKIAAAINFPLFALFCTPAEIRDLSLLYVTFVLIMAVGFNEWIESAQKSAQHGPTRAESKAVREPQRVHTS
ncbi:MAG: hypothetical protein WBF42_03020 [Terracidiphilus sp.]